MGAGNVAVGDVAAGMWPQERMAGDAMYPPPYRTNREYEDSRRDFSNAGTFDSGRVTWIWKYGHGRMTG